jgi:predicted nucleic acid-binding protein
VLVDTSAWIAYQRDVNSPTSLAVRRSIEDETVCTTDVVILELLAGFRPDFADRWSRLLAFGTHLEHRAWDDAESAATIYRRCRAAGRTPRSLVDCLIAAIAIRSQVPVLHCDRDYDVIAEHTELQVSRG